MEQRLAIIMICTWWNNHSKLNKDNGNKIRNLSWKRRWRTPWSHQNEEEVEDKRNKQSSRWKNDLSSTSSSSSRGPRSCEGHGSQLRDQPGKIPFHVTPRSCEGWCPQLRGSSALKPINRALKLIVEAPHPSLIPSPSYLILPFIL